MIYIIKKVFLEDLKRRCRWTDVETNERAVLVLPVAPAHFLLSLLTRCRDPKQLPKPTYSSYVE